MSLPYSLDLVSMQLWYGEYRYLRGPLFAGTKDQCSDPSGFVTVWEDRSHFCSLHAVYIPVNSHVASDVLVRLHGSGKAQKHLEDRGWWKASLRCLEELLLDGICLPDVVDVQRAQDPK